MTFNFATGAWSYTAPTSISGDLTETFQYSIVDTDGDVSSAPLTIHVEDRAGQLDGVLKTNPSAQNQFLTLSFFELAAADFRDSLHATAKIYDPFLFAPQGSIIQDAGFDINGTADYGVVLEASTTSATSIQVSEFAIENVTIEPTASPTAALQKDNTSSTSSNSTAIVAVIDPGSSIPAVLEQSKTLSTDGSDTGNTLTDTAANTLNYYYGADGIDTLNGSSDRDVLNGGGGVDTLNGFAGNDMLIYDGANNDTINGGDRL